MQTSLWTVIWAWQCDHSLIANGEVKVNYLKKVRREKKARRTRN